MFLAVLNPADLSVCWEPRLAQSGPGNKSSHGTRGPSALEQFSLFPPSVDIYQEIIELQI